MSSMLNTGLKSLRTQTSAISQNIANQVRHYAIPGGSKSVLTRRVKRKLTPGKTRPAIYYKFDCRVELSDGSTFVRRSQYPRVEWRYLADQRNNTVWNPSRTNLKAIEADATGRLAKFKQKFGFVDPIDSSERMEAFDTISTSDSSSAPADPAASDVEAKEESSTSAKSKSRQSLMDDYLDLMGENFVPVQSGGKLAGKRRGKK